MIHEPLTKLQCCPTSDGGAAAVIVSQAFLDARPHLKDQAILIAGQQIATDTSTLYNRSSIDLMGFGMTRYACRRPLLRLASTLRTSRSANCTIASLPMR